MLLCQLYTPMTVPELFNCQLLLKLLMMRVETIAVLLLIAGLHANRLIVLDGDQDIDFLEEASTTDGEDNQAEEVEAEGKKMLFNIFSS